MMNARLAGRSWEDEFDTHTAEAANDLVLTDAPYRVVVIDDDEQDVFLLIQLLKTAGGHPFEITHFESIDAFMASDAVSPDAVLLDRCMPDTPLTELKIQEIRAHHRNCGVILHTGMVTPSLRSTAAHEGALAVVEKGTMSGRALGALIEAAVLAGPELTQSRLCS